MNCRTTEYDFDGLKYTRAIRIIVNASGASERYHGLLPKPLYVGVVFAVNAKAGGEVSSLPS